MPTSSAKSDCFNYANNYWIYIWNHFQIPFLILKIKKWFNASGVHGPAQPKKPGHRWWPSNGFGLAQAAALVVLIFVKPEPKIGSDGASRYVCHPII